MSGNRGRSCGGVGLVGGEAAERVGVVFEQVAQLVPAAVQPGHHGADRAVGDLGDLLVREALDVGELDRQPRLRRQRLQRPADRRSGQLVEHLGLVPGRNWWNEVYALT